MKMLNNREKETQTPVQRKASLALMLCASLLKTPKSSASKAATKTKKPIQINIISNSVDGKANARLKGDKKIRGYFAPLLR